LPGALPVPNRTAIEWCIMIAQALNCSINSFSKFDRKNYFYPDLSKGFQISQYDLPFGEKGYISLKSGKKIGITRVHMEEDTGKLMHQSIDGTKKSLVDFNRCGVPLVEIVTEPDFDNAEDVVEYLQSLQQIVRYLKVSNADMEKGDMRLEPNISLTDTPGVLPPYKVEVKNINSFKFVEKAITYELARQEELLSKGHTPTQETRGWDENKNLTFSQRKKEEANDYRYFPEPDIPPLRHTETEISSIKSRVPELREKKIARFIKEFAIPEHDASQLTKDLVTANLFEQTVALGKEMNISAKQIANAITNKKISEKASPDTVLSFITSSLQVETIDQDELNKIVAKVLSENEKAVLDYKSGKESVIMFLVGQTMRTLGKKIDVQIVKDTIIANLA
jgi:aspartyl-tRNA(Asn)/glutamyl-tRNA(Gln) amidotransferase subunit B